MDMHPVRQPLFQLDDNRRVDLPITRRLPPLHVQESHHSNAYSNLMPITSLVHSPSRGEERRKSSFDTFDHRSDSKASQQSSDDSFSVYVEHRVRESTPQQQRSDAMSNDEHRSHSQTRHDRVYQTREAGERASHDGEEQDRSWPTVIDHEKEDEISSNQSIQSQGSLRPGDSQEQYDEEEMECDGDAAGEKKKRRRTNKAEANVLASV